MKRIIRFHVKHFVFYKIFFEKKKGNFMESFVVNFLSKYKQYS